MPDPDELSYLLSAKAVRERADLLFALAEADRLEAFRVDLGAMDAVVDRVHDVIRRRYPSLDVPIHARLRHFDAGGVPRLARLDAALARFPAHDRALAKADLVITSVLLDAGAGPDWRFVEPETGAVLARSEGLAVASLGLFLTGRLASDGRSLRVDADALESLDADALGSAFQVRADNPIVGLEGRLALLQGLARALRRDPSRFGEAEPRPSGFVRALVAERRRAIDAEALLGFVLRGFGSIWPGRVALGGTNLGDVWPHAALGAPGSPASLVPFHKLSQWLAYSLVEPLAEAGIEVTNLDALTGLPEYRNGGLFVDMGVLRPKDRAILARAHAPGSAVIVEWRALTVALLDRVAVALRARLGLDPDALPLAKVLEGGTWAAGREVARAMRPDGAPPITLESDGTVF